MSNTTNKVSILGSGWLGKPLAEQLSLCKFEIKLSTRSEFRIPDLTSATISPYIIDINQLDNNIKLFLDAHILIINITSKNIVGYAQLITEIEQSTIKHVLFISSTSVYANLNAAVTESNGCELNDHPLLKIENMFRKNTHFQTTVVRLAGLVGYARHPGLFFKNGKKVPQADAPVNLIHREDCIGIIKEIIQQQAWGYIFNGCADTHPTKREFYSYARSLLGLQAPEFIMAEKYEYKIINNLKVKQILNYSFKHPDVMKINFDGAS